jgi:hypothetical protein
MSQNQITDSVSLINFIKIHLSLSIFSYVFMMWHFYPRSCNNLRVLLWIRDHQVNAYILIDLNQSRWTIEGD